jgi:eukaryotic-like serine/threonine-protein kinase
MLNSKELEIALFDSAREFSDPVARQAFLDQACNGNAGLRERLEKLLSLHASAEEYFRFNPTGGPAGTTASTSAAAPSPQPNGALEITNTRIGRYRLLQRLGEGGCGVVYQAEQEQPIRRRVALKIIRLGMDTESVIARFEAERQALALMDHPNIAHVLDAGTTDSGRPYFVMELVPGVKVTDYCSQNHLDTRQRLKLFIQICHAIQHAHQKGVIHRDIKPSNILVTLHDGAPMPKVIDFGIAKATEGRLTDNTFHTVCDQFIGTPAYMSPEQADRIGSDVDTRSDIYSLGVLLYELLTGRTPFDSKRLLESGMDEMRRTLREREPQPPSNMLTTIGDTELAVIASQHHSAPPRLISSLQGDLDWIVMKALEKDRRRRYETADGLAMDVQRFLNNEPVVARPPTIVYRFGKLVRRNRLTFAAIAAVSLALLSGLGLSTWLFLKEREARQRATAAELQQVRLRQDADRLRMEAENRQKLTQATLLLSRDGIAEADALIEGIAVAEDNLEYADLFRRLGDWHVAGKRWKQAVDRFAVLVRVNQPENWDTLDHLRYGPALIESGDLSGYDRFRLSAIVHYTGTTNIVAAERVVKASLLLPADARLMHLLEPLAKVAAKEIQLDGGYQPSAVRIQEAWRYFSVSLLEYRRGNYASALSYCRRPAQYVSNNSTIAANVLAVAALAHCRLGQSDQAAAELAQCRSMVVEMEKNIPSVFWFDCVFPRILMREVEELLEPNRHIEMSESKVPGP